MTFADGVIPAHSSVKGFRVVASDGRAGRVSWASYAPGESYLVVTVGLLSRKHHVIPASAVTSVGDEEVRVGLARAQIAQLPDVPQPETPLADDPTVEQRLNAYWREVTVANFPRN